MASHPWLPGRALIMQAVKCWPGGSGTVFTGAGCCYFTWQMPSYILLQLPGYLAELMHLTESLHEVLALSHTFLHGRSDFFASSFFAARSAAFSIFCPARCPAFSACRVSDFIALLARRASFLTFVLTSLPNSLAFSPRFFAVSLTLSAAWLVVYFTFVTTLLS